VTPGGRLRGTTSFPPGNRLRESDPRSRVEGCLPSEANLCPVRSKPVPLTRAGPARGSSPMLHSATVAACGRGDVPRLQTNILGSHRHAARQAAGERD